MANLPRILPADDNFVAIFPKFITERRTKNSKSRDKIGKSILSGKKRDSSENTRRSNVSFAPRHIPITTKTRAQGLSVYGTNALQRPRIREPKRRK